MAILLKTTDKLRVTTDVAADLDAIFDFVDLNAGAVAADNSLATITTATTTDVVAAPSAGVRNIKKGVLRNSHASLAVTVTVFRERSATPYEEDKRTLQPGDKLAYDEGVGWFVTSGTSSIRLGRFLNADATGGNVTTAQPWFPTSGAVSVAAGTTYYFYGQLSTIRSAGTTSHTTSLLFGGTATLTSIQYRVSCNIGDVETTATDGPTLSRVATATAVKAASTSATEAMHCVLAGIVRINAAGTFIPQFQYSAAPGGAPAVKSNTYFFLEPNGSGSTTAIGTWT